MRNLRILLWVFSFALLLSPALTFAAPFTRTLSRGASDATTGGEVTRFQQFLISQNLLAPELATGYFGILTERAVQKFQEKNHIVSTGTPASTGYGITGPRTRSFLNDNTHITNPTPLENDSLFCVIRVSPNTLSLPGQVTVSWGTENATNLLIPTIGLIQPNELTSGSRTVFVATTTLFGGSVSNTNLGQNASCRGGLVTVLTSTATTTPPVVPPTPSVPTCTLYAEPSNIIKNGSSTLFWTTTGASSGSIDNTVGSISPITQGSKNISPTATINYTLTAQGAGGTVRCTTTVTVSSPLTFIPINGGLLQRSDVLFSPRFAGRTPDESGWLSVANAFRSNKIAWVYATPGDVFLQKATEGGYAVGVAVPFYIDATKPVQAAMQCLDINGNPSSYPFEKKYPQTTRRPDINIQAFKNQQLATIKKLVDDGYTSFHQDNPGLNAELVDLGGCFSDEGMAKFNTYLSSHLSAAQLTSLGIRNIHTFNYKTYLLDKGTLGGGDFVSSNDPIKPHYSAFQQQSTQDYYNWLHTAVRTYAESRNPGTQIYFSANLFNFSNNTQLQKFPWLVGQFDFGVAELSPQSASDVFAYAKMVGTNGRVNGVTVNSADIRLNKEALATAYASGLVMIAPWDVFVGSDKPRLFANPADFAPMFSLIRNNQSLFNNYTTGKEYSQYGQTLSDPQVTTAFVRQVVATTTVPARTIVYWNNIQGLKNIPNGSTVAIGDHVYSTVSPTTVGVFYLPPNAAVMANDPIWYVKAPNGAVLYSGSANIAITVRKQQSGNGNVVAHILNWNPAPLHIAIQLPRSELPNSLRYLITPEHPTPTTVSYKTSDTYTTYDLGVVDVWAILYTGQEVATHSSPSLSAAVILSVKSISSFFEHMLDRIPLLFSDL